MNDFPPIVTREVKRRRKGNRASWLLAIVGVAGMGGLVLWAALAAVDVASVRRVVEEEPAEPRPATVEQGEHVMAGTWGYRVHHCWWRDPRSEQGFPKRPNAELLFVELSVTNGGKRPAAIPPPCLFDSEGAAYEMLPETAAHEHALEVFGTLNPGVANRGVLVFDVPAARRYRLRAIDGLPPTAEAFIRLAPDH